MDQLLDTVGGLPVHVLVVHAVVVGVPAMSLITLAVATRRRWRASLAVPVAVVDGLLVLLTLVAQRAGEAFQERLGGDEVAPEHAERGGLMVWFTLALFLASALLAAVGRRGRTGPLLGTAVLLVAVTAVAAAGWTAWTGHSGSDAVWGDVVDATNP